jgi:PhnB protein
MSFHAYLFFSGDCREAFTRYQEIFGGELEIMSMAELPEGTEPMPGAEPHHVMHAAITVSDGLLMGSDDPTGTGGPKVGVAVSYSARDEADAESVFDALTDGGEVMMPLEPTFWSRKFGACTDRFGVQWMIDAGDSDPTG